MHRCEQSDRESIFPRLREPPRLRVKSHCATKLTEAVNQLTNSPIHQFTNSPSSSEKARERAIARRGGGERVAALGCAVLLDEEVLEPRSGRLRDVGLV